MRGADKLNSGIALILCVLISVSLIAWIAYKQDGAVVETVQVGAEGIKKAQEIKELLERPPESEGL
jgi:hypothetical protein